MDYNTYLGFKDPDKDRSGLISKLNKPLTSALFLERASQWASVKEERKAQGIPAIEPIYTLGEHEKGEVLSSYMIYMSSVDEFDAAIRLVGSVFHWQKLCEKEWFMDHVNQWREHMALRDFSLAKRITLEEARKHDGAAARHLLNFSHKVINPPPLKKTKRRGRNKDDTSKEDAEIDSLHDKVFHNGSNSKAG